MVLSGKKRPLLLIPVIIILFTLWVHYTRITSSVRIGVSLNLSETADPAELHMEQGIELAADILNEKGGINGRRLEIMTLDNKGNEKGSEIAAENAALRHAAALIGPLDSKLLSPTAIVGENRDLPIITPAHVDTDMWTDTCTGIPYNYVFTAALTSAEEGRAMAAFASQKLHKSRILVIYAGDSPRSTAAAEAFSATDNMETFSMDMHQHGTADLCKYLLTASYDAIYMPLTGRQAASFITFLRQAGRSPVVLGSSLWSYDGLEQYLPPTYLQSLFYTEAYGNDPTYEAGEEFAERYYAKYGFSADSYAASGFDAVMLIAEAVKLSDSTAPENVHKALSSISDYAGAAGPTTVQGRHITHPAFIFTFWQGSPALLDTQSPYKQ